MSKKSGSPIHAVRVPATLKDAFVAQCEKMGRDPSEMTRELMQATVDSRVTIAPTEAQKKATKDLYNES